MNDRQAIGRRKAVTLLEIMLGFTILALIFLPLFQKLTNAVRDTDRFYAECFAISQAKLVMDVLMFQIPFRCIHQGNPCLLKDPKGVAEINALLARVVPDMFQTLYQDAGGGDSYLGNGLVTDLKGFKYRIRVKCLDLENITFTAGGKGFTAKELSEKDADGKWNLMKKLFVEVRWSLTKGFDPLADPNARKIFLTAAKADLER